MGCEKTGSPDLLIKSYSITCLTFAKAPEKSSMLNYVTVELWLYICTAITDFERKCLICFPAMYRTWEALVQPNFTVIV